MKSDKNILIAFVLNFLFYVFEIFGGIITGSVAIVSDAIHDAGDALSIGISYFLERKSKKEPDDTYTYGYGRYSALGGLITTTTLILGSIFVIYNAVNRIICPVDINYNGMIIFAVFGVIVNFVAAMLTNHGESLNQKAVNLHMLEDVLGWILVLIGAVLMRFTDIKIIDPVMSIAVAVFIVINSVKNMSEILNLFLEKIPCGISVEEIKHHLSEIDEVYGVHHIHIWSIDGENNFATMHIVTDDEPEKVKKLVREELSHHGVSHITIEIEKVGEECESEKCNIKKCDCCHHHHHH